MINLLGVAHPKLVDGGIAVDVLSVPAAETLFADSLCKPYLYKRVGRTL